MPDDPRTGANLASGLTPSSRPPLAEGVADTDKAEAMLGVAMGLQTLQSIERLYRADREDAAIDQIDNVLQLPRGVEEAVNHLQQLIREGGPVVATSSVVASSKIADIGTRPSIRGGVQMVRELLLLRGKCFSAFLDSLTQEGRNKLAALALENAAILLQTYPTDFRFLIVAAQSYFILGNAKHAIEIGEFARSLAPEDPGVRTTLAIFRRGHKQLTFPALTERAVEMMARELAKRPVCDRTELQTAAALLEESLSIFRHQAVAWAALARVRLLEGASTLADSALQIARSLDASHPYVIETGSLMSSPSSPEASTAAANRMGSPEFRTSRAVAAVRTELAKAEHGRDAAVLRRASTVLMQTISEKPDQPNAWAGVAMLAIIDGDLTAAANAIQRAENDGEPLDEAVLAAKEALKAVV